MEATSFRCGCGVCRSGGSSNAVMEIAVCLKHSMNEQMHAALKKLYEVAGSTRPANFDEQDVQDALVAVAELIYNPSE